MPVRDKTESASSGQPKEWRWDDQPGGWLHDGSFSETADRQSDHSRLVGYLVRVRRQERLSPRDFALKLADPRHKRYQDMFPKLHQWLSLPLWEDWCNAEAESSAEMTVKHQGRDKHSAGWLGGDLVPASQIPRHEQIEDLRAEFRAEAEASNPFAIAYLHRYGSHRQENTGAHGDNS